MWQQTVAYAAHFVADSPNIVDFVGRAVIKFNWLHIDQPVAYGGGGEAWSVQFQRKLLSDVTVGVQNTAFCRKNVIDSERTHNLFWYSVRFEGVGVGGGGLPDPRSSRAMCHPVCSGESHCDQERFQSLGHAFWGWTSTVRVAVRPRDVTWHQLVHVTNAAEIPVTVWGAPLWPGGTGKETNLFCFPNNIFGHIKNVFLQSLVPSGVCRATESVEPRPLTQTVTGRRH